MHVGKSIGSWIVHSGTVSRPCLIKKKSRETSSPVPITHIVQQTRFRTVLDRCKKMQKDQKESNFMADGTTHVDNDFIKENDAKFPILLSQLGIMEPSPSTSGFLRQASNLVDQMVEVGPGVD